MYTVYVADETLAYDSRASAIDAAKNMSGDSYRRVDVINEEQSELFRYKNGELESYIFETRRGRVVER